MKSIFSLLAILALALPCAADSHKPIVRNGYVMRTIQQNAELEDWITGIQRAVDEATVATRELKAKNLANQEKISDLQINIDALTVRANDAEIRLKKMTDNRDFWRSLTFEVGIPLGLLSLALGVWTFRKPLLLLAGL